MDLSVLSIKVKAKKLQIRCSEEIRLTAEEEGVPSTAVQEIFIVFLEICSIQILLSGELNLLILKFFY